MGVATFRRNSRRLPQVAGETPSPAKAPDFVCPKCGKDCKIKMAYTNHVNACKG